MFQQGNICSPCIQKRSLFECTGSYLANLLRFSVWYFSGSRRWFNKNNLDPLEKCRQCLATLIHEPWGRDCGECENEYGKQNCILNENNVSVHGQYNMLGSVHYSYPKVGVRVRVSFSSKFFTFSQLFLYSIPKKTNNPPQDKWTLHYHSIFPTPPKGINSDGPFFWEKRGRYKFLEYSGSYTPFIFQLPRTLFK